jgi:ribonuclease Z
MASPAIEVILLGTGSPIPSADRSGPGQVVIAGSTHLLVDCGWGAARRLVPAGVYPASIDAVLFTHLHSDHITDFADFMVTRFIGGATRPLPVFGPEGTRATVDGFLAALAADTRYRLAHHGEKLHPDGMRSFVTEVPATAEATEIFARDDLVVSAFEVDHAPVRPALGYRIERAGRRVVISGDTNRCDALVEAARGADLLVCDAQNRDLMAAMVERLRAAGNELAASLLADTPSYHMSTLDAAAVAREAAVAHLVVSHLTPPVPNDGAAAAAFLAGMSALFPGKITLGHDLQRFAV